MIRLRPIGESDFQTVLDIFVEAFSPSPVPPIEYIANLCHTEPEGCLLAERDGVPVGYAAAHRSGSIGYIGTVAVRNAHRGHGYGKLLTEAVRDYLQTRCRVVGLAVDPK
ncbi:MAG: GNAT family N-acetyltransferase, partial [Candidatus Eisenbacteria bacterium]